MCPVFSKSRDLTSRAIGTDVGEYSIGEQPQQQVTLSMIPEAFLRSVVLIGPNRMAIPNRLACFVRWIENIVL